MRNYGTQRQNTALIAMEIVYSKIDEHASRFTLHASLIPTGGASCVRL